MSYDGRVYTVQIGDVMRKLPIFQVAPGVKIAIFNMLGDTEVVEMAADVLATRMPADGRGVGRARGQGHSAGPCAFRE